MKVLQQDTPVVSEYAGQIAGKDEVKVQSKVSGRVVEKYFHGGDFVQAGQPLYRIDSRQYESAVLQAQATLAQSQATLANAQTDLGRDQELLASDAISEQQVTTQQANVNAYSAAAAANQALLQKAVRAVVDDTFNMISVDGDTSTNDTLLLLSSGQAANKPILEEDESYAIFCEALFTVCRELAIRMAGDGEGATHMIEAHVIHADTKENARTLARSVVASSLVKAMIYGRDANCGRVLCALGYAGPDFDPAVITIDLVGEKDTLNFYKDGCVQVFDEDKALALLSEHDIRFLCDMNMGEEEAAAWGCDLTYDYVKINGDYRT